jgi:hypothetical protein
MELLIWITLGALAGGVAMLALPTGARARKLGRVAAGVVAAVLGGLVVNAVLGDLAQVRVIVTTDNGYGSFRFGLAPAIGAAAAALILLVGLQRTAYVSREHA